MTTDNIDEPVPVVTAHTENLPWWRVRIDTVIPLWGFDGPEEPEER